MAAKFVCPAPFQSRSARYCPGAWAQELGRITCWPATPQLAPAQQSCRCALIACRKLRFITWNAVSVERLRPALVSAPDKIGFVSQYAVGGRSTKPRPRTLGKYSDGPAGIERD